MSIAPSVSVATSIIYRSSGDGEIFYIEGAPIRSNSEQNETFQKIKMLVFDFGHLADRAGMPGWGDYYRKWEVPTAHLWAVLPPDIRRALRQ